MCTLPEQLKGAIKKHKNNVLVTHIDLGHINKIFQIN